MTFVSPLKLSFLSMVVVMVEVLGAGGGGFGGWGVRPCVVSAGFLYHHLINLRK